MLPKPDHLGGEYAAQFCDPAVVAAYLYRPPYPPATFRILTALIAAVPRTVLDAGCGTGDIARGLAPLVDRVDAVDMSAPMIALGRTLPGGGHSGLHWTVGRIEQAALSPPYALVTAGESLHWMDWDVALPRLHRVLAPDGLVAIVERRSLTSFPWDGALDGIIRRFSTNRLFQPYDIVDELTQRRLFAKRGEVQTDPMPVHQSVTAYVESFHSRNGFSRDRMPPADAVAFDRELTALIRPFAPDGTVALQIAARIIWGVPHVP